MNDKNIIQMPDGYLNKTPLFQFILLSCLFPLWGCAAALNDILITQFKSVFSLSNFASALVQSAFYGGYFLIAIPASLVIKKTSYKVAILIGLTLYIGGCTLFFLASHMDAVAYTMAATSTRNLQEGDDPDRGLRLFWCVVITLIPLSILFTGASLETM